MEGVEAFTDSIRKRLSDGLIGSFVLLFLLDHWKAVLFAVSGLAPDKKVDAIGQLLFADPWMTARTIVYPLAGALFYFFVWPFVSNWLQLYSLKREISRHNDAMLAETARIPERHYVESLADDVHELKKLYVDAAAQARGLRMLIFAMTELKKFDETTRTKFLRDASQVSENDAELQKLGNANRHADVPDNFHPPINGPLFVKFNSKYPSPEINKLKYPTKYRPS